MSNTAPFLHIAYANNNTGTLDFTTTGGIERTYTGFYTDEYSTDSSDPTKYKWLSNAEFKNKVNTAAYAKSADGTDGFTTVYPNLNLLTGTSTKVVQANKWNMQVADIKYDKSLGGALCASVMINNADQASVLGRGSAKIVLQTLDKSGNVLATVDGNGISYNANGLSQCYVSIDDNTASVQAFIFTNNMNQNAFYSCLKIEKGTITTPWMPSFSEVKDSDYPQYIGFSNVTNPTTFKDYEWTLLETLSKKILNTHVAYANSADGTDGFTTVYPNLNLIDSTKDFSGQWERIWGWENDGAYKGLTVKKQTHSLAGGICKKFTAPKDGVYTFSAYIKSSGSSANITRYVDVYNNYGVNVKDMVPNVFIGNNFDWSRDSFTVTLKAGYSLWSRYEISGSGSDSILWNAGHKWELGSIATPYMQSANEVTVADYPKYVGVGDDSTIASQIPAVYNWSSIPVPGPTPPVVDNLYGLTIPTVKSINLTYGVGTLTTKPVNWLSTKPKLDVNQVLWYKSEITGTANSVGVYYSNLIGGANLDDGDSPLDNTAVSMVLNNKIVSVPRDLALKLELLSQTSDKRDNELAQLIADTNDRITNIDMGSGQQGLIQEIADRKAGDSVLNTKIETTNGNLEDLKTNTETEFNNIEKQLGVFSIQGSKNSSLTRPSIVFDYNSYGTTLPDGNVDGGGRLYYQVPGDVTYAVRELNFNYQTIPSFYDLDQITIWENSWSKLYGGFPWRDTIITATDIDRFYIDGMTTYYDYNGDLVIRGKVVLDSIDDWIGQMNNRGFRPDSVAVTIAKDLKSVKTIRFTGVMGTIIMSINLGYGATSDIQRLGRRISFVGGSPKNVMTTVNSWVDLHEKIPYGMRPINTIEVSAGLLNSNNTICYSFGANSSIRVLQSSNNANQYQLMGQVGWETFDQYPPSNYRSNRAWKNR